MSHASMLKARRRRQKSKKQIVGDKKRAERAAQLALKGPPVKKVKKQRVKKEKVAVEKAEKTEKKPKPSKEELGRQEAKKGGAGDGKKVAES